MKQRFRVNLQVAPASVEAVITYRVRLALFMRAVALGYRARQLSLSSHPLFKVYLTRRYPFLN
jgi:hypothetical protein